MTWRWESSRNEVAGTEGKRKASVARRALNEAWNEPVSRQTGIGCEALRTGASGPLTAKLLRPKGSGVDPAIVRGSRIEQISYLLFMRRLDAMDQKKKEDA